MSGADLCPGAGNGGTAGATGNREVELARLSGQVTPVHQRAEVNQRPDATGWNGSIKQCHVLADQTVPLLLRKPHRTKLNSG